ncbi:ATP-dependent Clp protease ATP-binding subunit [Rapidithrix thailandica]|uniref:ATP-dependent Clp protease ATP-binding subunit n=1 Tax=Rapidithrix thailandica TaxID=413964 RepID=A0AAW9SME7_9BACT
MNNKNPFSSELNHALELAKKIAEEHRQIEYGAAHLLKAGLHRDFSLLKEIESMGIDVYFIEEWAEVRLEEAPKSIEPAIPEVHDSIDSVIAEAEQIREMLDKEEVDLFCALVALATPGVGFNFDQMKSFPVSRAELLDGRNEVNVHEELRNLPTQRSAAKFIHKYCISKTEKLKNKKLNIAGREKELKEITEIICRFAKPNVLLQGYPGVGKSALIDGFARLIIEEKVPEKLAGTVVYELSLGTLIAGATYKGDIEDRLKKVLQELQSFPKAILVIDGIHGLLDKNNDNSGISNILKSEVSKGLTLIVTTTVDEYTKKIEKDEGLSGIFEVIKIEEPDEDKAFRMIKSTLKEYTEHHEVEVNDETIRESIRLAERYLKEKSLPESALNLLDRTMSVIKTSGESFLKDKTHLLEKLAALKEKPKAVKEQEVAWFYDDLQRKAHYLLTQEGSLEGEILTENLEEQIQNLEVLIAKLTRIAENKKEHIEEVDVRAIVAQKTGIPLGKLQSEEQERLQNMEETLKKRVVGQDLAIQIVAEAILESRSGLTKAGQPIGSFFFLGPTGTGKTELAKSLADFLFQDENAIIRFDMSEFKEEHSAALLYGAPPGYVGYEEGGLLVNKIRQKPYSIVLFDEIEKAHPSVFDVFLQIMDEGKLHDRLGKEGDFSNALVLFTSNIGAQHIVNEINNGNGHPTSNQLMEIMANHFRPEFLGRLTEIIPFGPITLENATGIFEIHLKKELISLLEELNISLEIDSDAKRFLVENGFNATYGARPLKGIIRSELRRPLARKIIANEVKAENIVRIALEDGKLSWKVN